MRKNKLPLIIVDPKIRFGKPIIAGTRVPVEVVVGKIAGGMKSTQVAREYDLTQEQVLAALQYAAQIVAQEEVILHERRY